MYWLNPAPAATSFLGPLNAWSFVELGNGVSPFPVFPILGVTSDEFGLPSYEYWSCIVDLSIADAIPCGSDGDIGYPNIEPSVLNRFSNDLFAIIFNFNWFIININLF